MKNKTLYYIECRCIKDYSFPNMDVHIGDVFYFNKNASSNETYLWYSYKHSSHVDQEESDKLKKNWGWNSHLPLTRKKGNAKKWQSKRYADDACNYYIDKNVFEPVIKEIKVSYTEEYES